MSELERVAETWQRTENAGRSAVLATVVRVAGSTYRRPGARMLFPSGASPVGFVSGGCLEADLAERARIVLESGTAQTVVYDMRSPDDIVWGLGLGCAGEVRVLLERLSPGADAAWLGFVGACARERRDVAIATVIETDQASGIEPGQRVTLDELGDPGPATALGPMGQTLLADARAALDARASSIRAHSSATGRIAALVEYVPPAIALVVFGAGRDAEPLVRLGKEVGWRVTVADDRQAYLRPERFPEADALSLVCFERLGQDAPRMDRRTAVVVMTHHFLHDLELMRHLLATRVPYLGFLGPRQRTDKLFAELGARGTPLTAEDRSRLYGPVGLDIGSDTPEEIALAAIAEIRAVLAGRSGGFLRDARGPLHFGPR